VSLVVQLLQWSWAAILAWTGKFEKGAVVNGREWMVDRELRQLALNFGCVEEGAACVAGGKGKMVDIIGEDSQDSRLTKIRGCRWFGVCMPVW
jgi:hypothetical protein